MLFNLRVENDLFILSQAALLLTWHSPLSAIATRWMAMAVRYAKATYAHLFHRIHLPSSHSKPALKLLWRSCLIRDLMLALIMHWPLHIPPCEFDLSQPFVGSQDMEAKASRSTIHQPHIKIPQWSFLTLLCHLVAVMTDVVLVIYPCPSRPDCDYPINIPEEIALNIQKAESSFFIWEKAHPITKCWIHLSLYLNSCQICAACKFATKPEDRNLF